MRYADQPIAATLQRSLAEIVGLESKQNKETQTHPAEQRLALLACAERQLQQSKADQEYDQLEPHAVEDEPQRWDQEGDPGEAFFHEGEPVGARAKVGRFGSRLIHGIDGHGASRGSSPDESKAMVLALGRGHVALLALVDGAGMTPHLGAACPRPRAS